jgi:hypothetical protein
MKFETNTGLTPRGVFRQTDACQLRVASLASRLPHQTESVAYRGRKDFNSNVTNNS